MSGPSAVNERDDFERKTYYELLGVTRSAPPDEIRRSYREIAKVYHPDSNFYDDIIKAPLSERDKRLFAAVTNAYEVLTDPARRARYDSQLDPAPAPRTPVSQPAPAESVHPDCGPASPGWFMSFARVVIPAAVVLGLILSWLFRRSTLP